MGDRRTLIPPMITRNLFVITMERVRSYLITYVYFQLMFNGSREASKLRFITALITSIYSITIEQCVIRV